MEKALVEGAGRCAGGGDESAGELTNKRSSHLSGGNIEVTVISKISSAAREEVAGRTLAG